ncbi:hypothetical protein N7493_006470 [Penicillium malachiteum]|uniref:Uncharacterized protein n=1 Tax=Penicillium malachiteum TaxID=1324776 RepID=A0AAD6MVJ9_9EURO|nr:hypothetical protein N7493_006470 [Penicillium malachiteum]
MVRQQDSHRGESSTEMPPTGTQNSNGRNENRIPRSNPGTKSKSEPDYFTLRDTSKPSAAVVDDPSHMSASTNHAEAATGNGDYLHEDESKSGYMSHTSKGSKKHMTREEFDRFVGENDLGNQNGKVGVQQFFGLESSSY